MNPASGLISLNQVLGRDLPSGFPNWQFNVAANDEAGTPTSSVGYGLVNLVLQDVNDHSPVFDTCCLNGSVPEGAPAGKISMCIPHARLINRDGLNVSVCLLFGQPSKSNKRGIFFYNHGVPTASLHRS